MTEPRTGRCLCGAVTFEVTPPRRDVWICHCKQCAQWTGHQVAATAAHPDQLRILTGEEGITWYRSSDHAARGFCATCGSNLFWRPDHGQHVSIMAGTLDDPSGLSVGAHLYTDDERAYVRTDANAPHYPGDVMDPAGA